MLLVAILVMLALAAATAFVLLRDAKEKTYPARWDSRVAPYVQLVQNKRGLFFMHPVEVRFLPEAKFEKTIAADETKPSKKEREQIEQFTGLMRAFGLLKCDLDLSDSVDDFNTGGTLAYYSFDDERITIRGEKVTPAVRATLVHELTHVLQDQHFKIDDRMKKLRKADQADGTSESTLLDAHKATEVDVPKLKDGEKKFASGVFGVVTWYLMLAERMPLRDALAASDGWAGDAYVGFKRDGNSCARMTYAGDTPQDTKRMLSALRRWSAAAPGAPTKVSRVGDRMSFETCDPGKAVKVGKNASEAAVELVLIRNAYVMAALRADVPRKMARCLAGRLVQDFPVARLLDPKFGVGDPAVQARVQQFAAACR